MLKRLLLVGWMGGLERDKGVAVALVFWSGYSFGIG